MTLPSVSVLVVTFDHGRYVKEAIKSALGQSTPPLEVVVVDDGSTDDTVARIREIDDPRVRLVSSGHRGIERLAETYDLGLRACRGDLVAFLEGDDLWPPDKLTRQLPMFADPAVVASHGAYSVIGARGTMLREGVSERAVPIGRPYDALPRHVVASYIMAVTAIVRRDALVASGGFRQLAGTPHWDYPTFLALAERGPFAASRDVLGLWRKHGGSGTMRLAGRDLAGANLAMDLALETLRRYPDRGDLPSAGAVRRAWSEAYARQAWQVARVLLVHHRFDDARRVAWSGVRRSRSVVSAGRLLALCAASLIRIDVEGIGRVAMGRSTIEELS